MIFRQSLDTPAPLRVDSVSMRMYAHTFNHDSVVRALIRCIPLEHQAEICRLRAFELEAIRLRKKLILQYSDEFEARIGELLPQLPTLFPEEFI